MTFYLECAKNKDMFLRPVCLEEQLFGRKFRGAVHLATAAIVIGKSATETRVEESEQSTAVNRSDNVGGKQWYYDDDGKKVVERRKEPLDTGDKMATSYFRGHLIIWNGEHWCYEDTGEAADFVRPCKTCGAVFDADVPDPCLGNLPGVTNACCGHGVPSQAYILFENGVVVKRFVVEKDLTVAAR